MAPTAPRWSWRALFWAVVFTGLVYLVLPYLELVSQRATQDLALRAVDTLDVPPPPPPIPPPAVPEKAAPTSVPTPKPVLERVRPPVESPRPVLDLDIGLPDIGGDFDLGFAVTAPVREALEGLVFDLGDLDEPPSPLSRIRPMYPPQARLRAIEGVVIAEFVIDAEGATGPVRIISSHPPGTFDAAAIRAIARWRFQPGRKDGKPVATRVRQKVNFRLE
jgi:protein TonB